jgi:hypothetical protein
MVEQFHIKLEFLSTYLHVLINLSLSLSLSLLERSLLGYTYLAEKTY